MIKNILLIFLALTCLGITTPPRIQVIQHKYYKTTFDQDLNYPVKVEYWLTKSMIVCDSVFSRNDFKFKGDPLLKNTNFTKSYSKSGYDKGHNFPAGDSSCDEQGLRESFYFTNITPQASGLNRGAWKSLEDKIRKLSVKNDSIYIVTGSIQGISTKTIGGYKSKKIAVPFTCWKAYWIKGKNIKKAYLFPNMDIKAKDLEKYKISILMLEKQTGKLF